MFSPHVKNQTLLLYLKINGYSNNLFSVSEKYAAGSYFCRPELRPERQGITGPRERCG